ncbi:MAG: cytochrome c [Azospirillaceae bacterium]|nr:cytochrome c [Azospirillaceae bacterium]
MRKIITAALVSALAPLGAQAQDVAQGQDLFNHKCAACHQKTGQGVKGAFPALAGDPFVQGDAEPMVRTVLQGRGGMPTFAAVLSEQQLADIISYVRQAWGNSAPAVDAAFVTQVKNNAHPQDKAPVVTH